MFTPDQIKTAHAKVKSGADFPAYIREPKQLGVHHYHTFVADGHTDYFGSADYTISSTPKYNTLPIAAQSDVHQFKSDLAAHQQGKTDYLTFCNDCAKSGVEKWIVSLSEMTCTYYDKSGSELLQEVIPA
jgi:uncharacterized protein YbcV (DUF1398 family)